MEKEAKITYGVVLHRKDGVEPILAIQSEDYDECFKTWEKLVEEWKTCAHEQTPFKLTSPVVTAFEPGLIYAINIIPISKEATSKAHNPYHNEMVNRGFSNTFPKASGMDLLDKGYNF